MSKKSTTCRDTEKLFTNLSETARRQFELTGDILEFTAKASGQLLHSVLAEISSQKSSTCCDIPEPCWMPVDLGDLCCALCPGSRGVVDLKILNTDFQPRKYSIVTAGPDAARTSISPDSFTLGPKERRSVRVTFDSKLDEKEQCAEFETLIWLLGCRNHYARWKIIVGNKESTCCHELEVHDGPDYAHHWFDHFYNLRPCYGPLTTPRPEG